MVSLELGLVHIDLELRPSDLGLAPLNLPHIKLINLGLSDLLQIKSRVCTLTKNNRVRVELALRVTVRVRVETRVRVKVKTRVRVRVRARVSVRVRVRVRVQKFPHARRHRSAASSASAPRNPHQMDHPILLAPPTIG